MQTRWSWSTASPMLILFLLVTASFSITAQATAQAPAQATAQTPAQTPTQAPATNPSAASSPSSSLPTAPQTGSSPTSTSPSQLPSANPQGTGRPCQSTVLWDGTDLRVDVSNCDLNPLLQQIAAKTGTTLTGTAPGERIFGKYGPGTLDAVLSSLLEGIPVNVLLVDRSGAGRKELVLSARGGPPSPPSPAPREDTSVNATNSRPAGAYGASRAEFNAAQQLPQLHPVPQAGITAQQPGQAPPPSDGTPPASPNGVKTPQEIFEQLQRLRTQQTQ